MSERIHRMKAIRRPSKGSAAKARRLRTQRRRLVALGVPAAEADKLNSTEVRGLLRRPARLSRQSRQGQT